MLMNFSLSAILGLFFIPWFFIFSPLRMLINPLFFFVRLPETQLSVFRVLFLSLPLNICGIKASLVTSQISIMYQVFCLFLILVKTAFSCSLRNRLLHVISRFSLSSISELLLSSWVFFCVFVRMLKKVREKFSPPFLVFLLGTIFVLLILQFLTYVLVYLKFYFGSD